VRRQRLRGGRSLQARQEGRSCMFLCRFALGNPRWGGLRADVPRTSAPTWRGRWMLRPGSSSFPCLQFGGTPFCREGRGAVADIAGEPGNLGLRLPGRRGMIHKRRTAGESLMRGRLPRKRPMEGTRGRRRREHRRPRPLEYDARRARRGRGTTSRRQVFPRRGRDRCSRRI
jgi:hypothetical protein